MKDDEQPTRKALFEGIQAKESVDLNLRLYTGSLWISYSGSTKVSG